MYLAIFIAVFIGVLIQINLKNTKIFNRILAFIFLFFAVNSAVLPSPKKIFSENNEQSFEDFFAGCRYFYVIDDSRKLVMQYDKDYQKIIDEINKFFGDFNSIDFKDFFENFDAKNSIKTEFCFDYDKYVFEITFDKASLVINEDLDDAILILSYQNVDISVYYFSIENFKNLYKMLENALKNQ